MKKNIIIYVLAGTTIILAALLLFQPKAEDGSMDDTVRAFFEAVEENDTDTYTAMIQGWDEFGESTQRFMKQTYEDIHESLAAGDGIQHLEFFNVRRFNIPIRMHLNNGETFEHTVSVTHKSDKWMISD